MLHDLAEARTTRAASLGTSPAADSQALLHALAPILDEAHRSVLERALSQLERLDNDSLWRAIRRPHALQQAGQGAFFATLASYRKRVLDEAARCLDGVRPPENLRALYDRSLADTAALASLAPCLPAIDFCAAVHVAEGGSLGSAVPLSVAGLFYYMGISLFDDVVDRDLDEHWLSHSEPQVSFASIAMFSGLPTLALTRLLGAATSARMSLWLQEAAYEMATGQYLDVRIGIEDATLDHCDQINQGKTGSTGALAARLGAAFAGASDPRIEAYADACRDLYVSMQIASDIQDVWCKPISPDLRNGIMTLPIVYALHSLPQDERSELAAGLRAGDDTREGHAKMRALITRSGALRYALMRAELHRTLALCSFNELARNDEGCAMLSYFAAVARLGSWES